MANKVYANMMEVSCKAASGKTICAFPDVCMTPPMTPATPPGVPIPYPNTGMATDATDGSTSVQISGKEVMLKNKSCFSKSSGDEAGSAPKKGVVTSKNMGKVYFNMWSMDVKVEGENVVRHLDITTHNHASMPGNSPPMPHVDGMAPPAVDTTSEPKVCPLCPTAGKPVNPVLGAKVLSGEEDLDFVMEGPMPFVWQRTYLSTHDGIGWLGRGWSTPLETRLELIPDASGRVVEQLAYVDAFGRRIVFPSVPLGGSHQQVGVQLTLTRPDPQHYEVTGSDGVSEVFTLDASGPCRLTARRDRNGNQTLIEYQDAGGVLASMMVRCSGKQVLRLVFQSGRLVAITRVLQGESGGSERALARYHFSKEGDLSGVLNRAGECMRQFEYDEHRLMRRQVYAGMFEAFYAYERFGDVHRVVRHWDNVGRTWRFDYRADHTAVTDQDGHCTRYHFDDRQRWVGLTDAAGQFTQFGLDALGNLRAVVDPAENVTETVYDEQGRAIEYHDASGGVARIDWHPQLALPLALIDPLNRKTSYQYDDKANLLAQVEPDGSETSYERDERGLVVAVTDALGGVSRLAYNDAAQLVSHTDCSGHRTEYRYDLHGDLVARINALGETTTWSYDEAGRLLRQTNPDGSFEAYERDLAGHMTRMVDAQGRVMHFQYAPDGQLTERTNALGHKLRYGYNKARKLTTLVNENGAHYRFGRDVLGRLIEETRFDGTQIRYAYNLAGHLIESVEAPGTPHEIRTRLIRDAMGRLIERIRPQTHSVFRYDEAGQLTLAATREPPTRVDLKYDKAGRRIEECVTSAERAYVLRHAYDALGNRLSITLPDGTRLGTLYYGSGHAHQVNVNGDPVVDIERDVLHREATRTQGKLTTWTQYGPDERVVRRQTFAHALSGDGAPGLPQGPVVLDRAYRYDALGRLIQTIEPQGALRYGYDALDRLTHFNEERFAFDPANNLLPVDAEGGSQAGGAVPDNRVSVLGAVHYRFDGLGRVVEKHVGSSKVIQLRWNDEHRLVESHTQDVRGARTTRYVYDALGRRILKRDEGGDTWFVWDKDRLLQSCREGDEYTYIYEPDSFVPMAQLVRQPGARLSQLYHFHCDQVGVPRELTNVQGEVCWAGRYKGWGALLGETSSSEAHAPALRQDLRLQGSYCDEETGLHYNLMRYYDPDSARFISRDPIGLMGGINEYAFAPNPVFWIDPWGLTGTYIFSNGKVHYIGKGPADRFKQSKKERLPASCPATAESHEDYGDDDMGFMVEHLLMQDYGVPDPTTGFANAIGSPGKKRYDAAPQAVKDKARANADKLKADFKKQGGC